MAGGDDMRFSDSMLLQLREDFDKHVTEEMSLSKDHLAAQNANVEAISKLTVSVATLTDNVSALTNDTRDIIQTYKDLQGVARIGSGAQRFAIWCMKWGSIGAAGAAVTIACGQWRILAGYCEPSSLATAGAK